MSKINYNLWSIVTVTKAGEVNIHHVSAPDTMSKKDVIASAMEGSRWGPSESVYAATAPENVLHIEEHHGVCGFARVSVEPETEMIDVVSDNPLSRWAKWNTLIRPIGLPEVEFSGGVYPIDRTEKRPRIVVEEQVLNKWRKY